MAFVAAGQRVEMVPAKTWLEQVHRNNTTGWTMKDNSFHNKVYLGKTEGRFNPIPEELQRAVWTGTAAVIGDKGRKLGKQVETPCNYAGNTKIVLFEPTKEQQTAEPDTIFMCNQGFTRDGSLYVPLSNARTDKPIVTEEDMIQAEEVKMEFRGQVSRRKVRRRDGGAFEQVGDENSLNWFSDKALLGLLGRGPGFNVNVRHSVSLFVLPSYRRGVAVEASEAGAPLEAGAPVQLKLTRENPDTPIVKGTPELLDAAVRLLGQLNKQ